MDTLQTIVLPNLDLPGDEALYVRRNDRVACELGEPRLRFVEGGEVWTDTFYGGLTVAAWKQTSPITNLLLELAGAGEFIATLGVHRLGHAMRWLCEHAVLLSDGVPVRLPVHGWKSLSEGMLFVRVRALGPGVIEAMRYVTPDLPPNDVRLGLVITHFNRQAQVMPAIERLRRQVLQRRPELDGRITLTVVDNSRNLPVQPGGGLRHLPNVNLGGSGGFARGLLALEDEGRATHALFMDDDASCEAECILRTYALLRHAGSPALAIAGALLNEAQPAHLLEKGARFDGECQPLHADKDLRVVHDLLQAERGEAADYGGWWFFAFPLKFVTRYPFPFFVRGDDVMFSLTNRFEIRTFNGIGCLAEEFRLKHGPLTAYLDARYHLLHLLLRERGERRALRRLVSHHFLRPLKSYQYASARAFTLALRHITQGPRFFRENIDLAAVRAEIAAWTPAEKMEPIDRSALKLCGPRSNEEGRLRRLLRLVTLQGFLLPRALLIDRTQVQDKAFHGRPSALFRFRQVLYEHAPSDTGYVASHDRRLAFAELRDFIGALRAFRRHWPALRTAYTAAYPALASRAFWREVYGRLPLPQDAGPSATPASAEFESERRAVGAAPENQAA